MRFSCHWIASLVCFLIFALVLAIRPSLFDVRLKISDLGFPHRSTRQYGAASVTTVNDLYFVTEFSLGTPPQSFRALIQHSPAHLSVPSIFCKTESCAHYHRFDSNQSSTAATTGRNVNFKYGSTSVEGTVSTDTLTIAGIQIPNQPFVEADRQVEEEGEESQYRDHDFDAFLSLSPIDMAINPEPGLNTPFMSMINQRMLDAKCFSLKPPQSKTGEPGQLTFGRTTDHTRLGNRLIRIPITNTVMCDVSSLWQVEARAVHAAGKSTILASHTAVIDAGYPFITLPRRAIAPLFRSLEPIGYLGYSVRAIDCDRRGTLPDITVDLGGHNFTITAYEYTYESDFHGGGTRCLLAIDDTEKDCSVLGASFLKRFYSLFDWDEKRIGLIPLEQFNEQYADYPGYDSL